MQISRSSDPLFKDRIVVASYEENTRPSYSGWLIFLLIIGLVAAGVYFWPQLNTYWQQHMQMLEAEETAPPAQATATRPATDATVSPPATTEAAIETTTTAVASVETMPDNAAEATPEPLATASEALPESASVAATDNNSDEVSPTAANDAPVSVTDADTNNIAEADGEIAATEPETAVSNEAGNEAEAEVETEVAESPVAAQAADIAELQEKARQQIIRTRLTSPAGDNAYETAQALRALDPAAADAVIDQIITWYATQGEEYVEQGRLFPPGTGNAYTMYERMAQIAPEHAQTIALRTTLLDSQQALAEQRLADKQLIEPEAQSVYAVQQLLESYFPEAELTQHLKTQIIDTLLQRGERQIKARKFTTPEDDNAYDTYSSILAIFPEHPQALAGIEKVVEEYVRLGRLRMNQGRYSHARVLVDRGLQIAPENAALLELKNKLNEPRIQSRLPPENHDNLMTLAQQQLAAGRLARPQGNNATETYQRLKQVLGERDSRLLTLGGQLGEAYFNLARQQFIDNQPQQSLKTVNAGLVVLGEHEKLTRFQQELQFLLNE